MSRDAADPASADLAVGIYVRGTRDQEESAIPGMLEINYRLKKRRVPVRVIEQGDVVLEDSQAPAESLGKESL